MSTELFEKLKHRALVFLDEARSLYQRGEYDLACFAAEQAAQLYVKAVLFKVFGETPRIHGVRELLGVLVSRLRRAGFAEHASRLEDLVRELRGALLLLEDAYTDARYSPRSFGEDEARYALCSVEKLISLLREVEKLVDVG